MVRAETLFAQSRQQLFGDDWALLILYRARYPDRHIERKRSETLYRIAADDADPKRREIAEAMKEVGSEAALPVLEAISFDLAASVNAREIFGQAVEPLSEETEDFREKLRWKLPALEATSRRAFLEAVTAAIAAINARSGTQTT